MQEKYIEPDRWHDKKQSLALRLQQLYGTPRSWFRRSVYIQKASDLENIHDAADEDTIRCAAVFPRGTDVNSLTSAWSLVVWPRVGYTCGTVKDWVMVIASPEDSDAWIAQARSIGARAWYQANSSVKPWRYRAIDRSEPEEDYQPPRLKSSGVHGGYDQSALIADLKTNYYSMTQLAEKYQISKTTVSNIAAREGITKPKRGATHIDQQLAKIDHAAVIADLRADMMTKSQIARKHGVAVYAVTRIQAEAGLLGKLTFHKRLRAARLGGRPQSYNYDEDALVADIRRAKQNGWTRQDVADRHGIKVSTLAGVQQKHGIKGTFVVTSNGGRKPGSKSAIIAQKANKKAP